MSDSVNLEAVGQYFQQRLDAHGPTPLGVDWNSDASQALRFDQLLKVVNPAEEFSINDYGCGYGALIDHLVKRGLRFRYTGFDLLESMVEAARIQYAHLPNCTFTSIEAEMPVADYTVASGVFNMRLETPDEPWLQYSLACLHTMNERSSKGMSFNMLTKYSDADRMRPDLYYADPCVIFDYCKRNFSRHVALLHDYGAYDFTILVRHVLP